MAGRLESLWKNSQPKPGEEGAFGPYDNLNRLSYKASKPAALISTGALLIGVPMAGIALMATGIWAGSDKIQLETSKWIRRKFSGDMKPGKAVQIAQK